MTTALTVEGLAGGLSHAELQPLVSGVHRAAQERRLRAASIVVRRDERIVAAAVRRGWGNELRIEEVGIASDAPDDEMADGIIDLLETIALAGGYSRLIVSSSAASLRRALRLLGYVPQTRGHRQCFVRRFVTGE